MPQFEDREKAFEAKFHQDQELQFKVRARRNRLLGLWVAKKLGLDGSDAEAYAKDVVDADFDKPGEDDVVAKIMGDLQGKGVDVTEHAVRREMDSLLATAKQQVSKES